MKRHHRLYWSALTGVCDTEPRGMEEVYALQRRAWQDNAFIVLSCNDERLDDEDRVDLHRIGERLFLQD